MNISAYSTTNKCINEDRYFYSQTNQYTMIAGVCDGHGGVESAEFCKKNFCEVYTSYDNDECDVCENIKKTFRDLHTQCCKLGTSGCTLTNCLKTR